MVRQAPRALSLACLVLDLGRSDARSSHGYLTSAKGKGGKPDAILVRVSVMAAPADNFSNSSDYSS